MSILTDMSKASICAYGSGVFLACSVLVAGIGGQWWLLLLTISGFIACGIAYNRYWRAVRRDIERLRADAERRGRIQMCA